MDVCGSGKIFGMPHAIYSGVREFNFKISGGNANGDHEEVSDQQQELQKDHGEKGQPKGSDLLCEASHRDAYNSEDHHESRAHQFLVLREALKPNSVQSEF